MIKEEFIDINDVRMVEEDEVNDEEMNNNDDEDDDDNIVVREIDVYLSTEMQKHLYLLQYPLQQVQVQEQEQEQESTAGSKNNTTNTNLKNSNQLQPISQVRIKPRHNRLDIIHPIPLQQMEDDNNNNNNTTNRYSELYERTYTSQPIPIVTHMCIGKLKVDPTTNNSTFHLIPLQHIYQMRPTFDHIDNDNNNNSNNNNNNNNDSNNTVQSVTFQQQQLTRNNSNKESERAQMARLNSYMYKKQSEENELWYELQILDNYSIHYHTFIKKMIVSYYLLQKQKPDTSSVTIPYVLKSKAALLTDVIDTTDTSTTELTDTTTGNTNESIQVSVLTIKVLSLLRYGWQVPYQLIRHQFVDTTTTTTKISDTVVLSILNSCCVLVRGNFTLQSKYVVLNDDITTTSTSTSTSTSTVIDNNVNNGSTTIMQPIRTFILLLLRLYGYIQRPALTKVFIKSTRTGSKSNKISSEMIGHLLEMNCKLIKHYSPYCSVVVNTTTTTPYTGNNTQVTIQQEDPYSDQQQQQQNEHSSRRRRRRRGWVPKIDDDTTIATLFPETVQLHNLYWEQQKIRFQKQLHLYNKYKNSDTIIDQ